MQLKAVEFSQWAVSLLLMKGKAARHLAKPDIWLILNRETAVLQSPLGATGITSDNILHSQLDKKDSFTATPEVTGTVLQISEGREKMKTGEIPFTECMHSRSQMVTTKRERTSLEKPGEKIQ